MLEASRLTGPEREGAGRKGFSQGVRSGNRLKRKQYRRLRRSNRLTNRDELWPSSASRALRLAPTSGMRPEQCGTPQPPRPTPPPSAPAQAWGFGGFLVFLSTPPPPPIHNIHFTPQPRSSKAATQPIPGRSWLLGTRVGCFVYWVSDNSPVTG